MTYQFNIQLIDINNPVVWRQLTIPGGFTFFHFHEAIQAAFGWKPYEFDFKFFPEGSHDPSKVIRGYSQIGNVEEEARDAPEILLPEEFTQEGQVFIYIPSNRWEHRIVLEKILDAETRKADCLAGEGACPPEYCEGPAEYENMKRILADKAHPEYESTKEWLDLSGTGDWEENHKFDLAQAQQRMKQVDGGPELFRNYHFIPHDTFDDMYGLTPALWNTIDNKNARVKQGKKGIISELEALAHKYPGIPHFRNMLASALAKTGVTDRFLEIEQQVFEEFPDYVMARYNLISHYSTSNQLDKAAELLGEELDLEKIYPNRNGGFTDVEIYCYHAVAFQYLVEKGDDVEAEKHLEFLQHFFPKRTTEERLYLKLINLRLKNGPMNSPNQKDRVEVIPEEVTPTNEAPVFTHPEVEIFYQQGTHIDRDAVQRIMELPRETLVEDMKKMLVDSVARHDYFYDGIDWTDNTHTFPLHALFVLSSLKAEEGLDALFTVMRQSESFLDFWYSDLVTEEFWHFIYLMGQNRLDRLRDFILEPNRYTYIRTAVSEAVKQVALHQPQRHGEIIEWYRDTLQYMIGHKDEQGLIDPFVFACLVNDLVDIAGKDEWLFIRQCYAADLDHENECYHLENVKNHLAGKRPYPVTKSEIYTSIDQFYDDLKKWDSYNKPVKKENDVPHIAKPKVGRNDPCPCGSGKKYKKCCGANK